MKKIKSIIFLLMFKKTTIFIISVLGLLCLFILLYFLNITHIFNDVKMSVDVSKNGEQVYYQSTWNASISPDAFIYNLGESKSRKVTNVGKTNDRDFGKGYGAAFRNETSDSIGYFHEAKVENDAIHSEIVVVNEDGKEVKYQIDKIVHSLYYINDDYIYYEANGHHFIFDRVTKKEILINPFFDSNNEDISFILYSHFIGDFVYWDSNHYVDDLKEAEQLGIREVHLGKRISKIKRLNIKTGELQTVQTKNFGIRSKMYFDKDLNKIYYHNYQHIVPEMKNLTLDEKVSLSDEDVIFDTKYSFVELDLDLFSENVLVGDLHDEFGTGTILLKNENEIIINKQGIGKPNSINLVNIETNKITELYKFEENSNDDIYSFSKDDVFYLFSENYKENTITMLSYNFKSEKLETAKIEVSEKSLIKGKFLIEYEDSSFLRSPLFKVVKLENLFNLQY